MRTLYTFLLLSAFAFSSGCSKDFLKSYDKRILGTWKITDVDRYGFNGSDALPLKEEDLITFDEDGALTLQRANNTYQGSWDIQRIRNGDDEERKALHITAIDFDDQQVRSEYFNDMTFTGSDRFKAFVNYNTRTYVYRLTRQ